MPEGFSFSDYSQSQVYAMVRLAISLDGEPKTPDPRSAWSMADYALYNHVAKDLREARSRGLVYDPYGVGVNLD